VTSSPSPSRSLASFVVSLRTLLSFAGEIGRLFRSLRFRSWTWSWSRARQEDDPEIADLMRRAGDARRAHGVDAAAGLYRQVLERRRTHAGALRALRDFAVSGRQWREALSLQERLVAAVTTDQRAREAEMLAAIHYERGREEMASGRPTAAIGELRQALRSDRRFVPAALALGEAYEAAGDAREAVRAWERAVEITPALPLLGRLERAYRAEGRPSRMIALYRDATARAPDDLALALALGRVYFELEMLDEAADQLEKIEVRAPSVPAVHALLGAVFEHRGQTRDAVEEYRQALTLADAFAWPLRCRECGAPATTWEARCGRCGFWNAIRPVNGR
jgi:lipopolysaccharide biosynthesis regulator YciM